MKIIIYYNHKGGVSKTTLSVLSATNLKRYYNKSVCFADFDNDQWSASAGYDSEHQDLEKNNSKEQIEKMLKANDIVQYDIFQEYTYNWKQFLREIEDKKYDFLFVDLGNRNLNDCSQIFESASAFFIPFNLAKKEITKAISFFLMIRERHPDKKIWGLPARIEYRKSNLEKLEKVKGLIHEKYKFSTLKNIFLKRNRYINGDSFFFPLNKKDEEGDVNRGFLGLLEEIIHKVNN